MCDTQHKILLALAKQGKDMGAYVTALKQCKTVTEYGAWLMKYHEEEKDVLELFNSYKTAVDRVSTARKEADDIHTQLVKHLNEAADRRVNLLWGDIKREVQIYLSLSRSPTALHSE